VPDVPDLRDWPFEPSLRQLRCYVSAPRGLLILDQQQEGACTGFGLAAVIKQLNQQRGSRVRVSPRMLYEMARLHDEWPGEDYAGPSCRGAIKGWYNMRVCTEGKWPYVQGRPGALTVARAKSARDNTIGAYYRIQPRVSNFHAAINEAGAIFRSARTHAGWMRPNRRTGAIPLAGREQGGHAFAIVGNNSKGFWVQNSWGRAWGRAGLGLWQSEDWLEKLMDGWLFSLALPTPQIWHLPQSSERNRSGLSLKASTARSEIAGHFVHVGRSVRATLLPASVDRARRIRPRQHAGIQPERSPGTRRHGGAGISEIPALAGFARVRGTGASGDSRHADVYRGTAAQAGDGCGTGSFQRALCRRHAGRGHREHVARRLRQRRREHEQPVARHPR
jgi:hypothetical protein